MEYVLLTVSVLSAVINNSLLHLPIVKKGSVNEFLFNAGVVAVWVVLLAVYNGGIRGFSRDTFIYGAVYGIILAGFLFCKMQAFSNGPIHYTSLIGSSSFILTTVFNAVYWKEFVNAYQIAGIILMLAAVVMITCRQRYPAEEKQILTWKWKVYAAAFFLFSALTGIVFRFHQSVDAVHTDEMMIFASMIVTVLLAVAGGSISLYERRKSMGADIEGKAAAIKAQKKTAAIILIAAACGVVSCIYNRLNIYLCGVMANSVFFPLFNGGNILLTTLAGCILFRERLHKLQIAGVFCGLTAILLVSNFFGLL